MSIDDELLFKYNGYFATEIRQRAILKNLINYDDFIKLFKYEHHASTIIDIIINFNYDDFIVINRKLNNVDIADLIPKLERVEVPKRSLFKNNQYEIDETLNKNKLIDAENLKIASQNEQIQKENQHKFDNAQIIEVVDLQYDKLKDAIYKRILQEDIRDFFFKKPISEICKIFFDNFLKSINQPIKINNNIGICRLYEIIDFEATIKSKSELKEHCINYMDQIKFKQNIQFDFISDNDINYKALCQLDKVDWSGLQQLFEPYIQLEQIKKSEANMKKFEYYQTNMQSFVSPLLKSTNEVNAKINAELDKYNQQMISHANNLQNIVENMDKN